MKFDYKTEKENREVVAIISATHFYVKTDDGGTIGFPSDESYDQCKPFYLPGDGMWENLLEDATKKFYKGDSITITF